LALIADNCGAMRYAIHANRPACRQTAPRAPFPGTDAGSRRDATHPFDATRKSKQSHDRTLQAITQRHKLGGSRNWLTATTRFGSELLVSTRFSYHTKKPANAFQGAEFDPLGGGGL
jgi:hypothetical protein